MLEVINEPTSQVASHIKYDSCSILKCFCSLDLIGKLWSPEFFDDCHALGFIETTLECAHLKSAEPVTSCNETLGRDVALVMARAVGERNLKSHLSVSMMLLDKQFCRLFKSWKHIAVDIIQLSEDAFGLGLLHIFLSWDTDSLEFDSCEVFNPVYKLFTPSVVESDTGS